MSFQDDRTFQGNPMLDVLSADPIWAYSMMACQWEEWDAWWEVHYHRPWEWDSLDEAQSKILYMSGMARRIQRSWFNREEQPMACPCPESP